MLIPPNDRYKLAQMLVPIDDVNTMFYWIAWHETGGIPRHALGPDGRLHDTVLFWKRTSSGDG